jgi:alanyl-tRNA synthetase
MQNLRSRFRNPDGTTDGSIQSCIRTNDLDLVGDGSHATLIEMVGNFSFGRSDYEDSVELWHRIVRHLSIPVTHVTVHPTRDDHRRLWVQRGYRVIPDLECVSARSPLRS